MICVGGKVFENMVLVLCHHCPLEEPEHHKLNDIKTFWLSCLAREDSGEHHDAI